MVAEKPKSGAGDLYERGRRSRYDNAVTAGKQALAENVASKQAAEKLGYVPPEDFGRWVRSGQMVQPGAMLGGGG